MQNKNQQGEKANSPFPESHSNRLIYVRYRDHALFRNSNSQLHNGLNIREVVGWLTREEDDFLVLTTDRSVEPLPFEIRENFLIIIKSDILKKKEIKYIS